MRTNLKLFQAILVSNTLEHIFLATLLQFSSQQQFVQDVVCLLKVEYYIQLAHVTIVFVHMLDIAMHHFQRDQLVICGRSADDEKE